jgi:GNAT superfamily N-acetyltransferase
MIGVGGRGRQKCTSDIFMDKEQKSFIIRKAHPTDAQSIYELIVELAIYEKEPNAVQTTPEIIAKQLLSPTPPFHCVVAQEHENIVGFALYFFNYSTWRGQRGIYLEDLFVQEVHRKKGIALSLMQFLAQTAKEEDCGRIDWSVLKWNQLAIDFYKRLGASEMSEWVGYRLEDKEISSILNHTRDR